MTDQYGREIEYLRVSVTDRCNLRCSYCMPEEGVEQVAHNEILTYSEIARICRICADKGVSKIKLTGGEPLVRKGISGLLYELRQIDEMCIRDSIHHALKVVKPRKPFEEAKGVPLSLRMILGSP